MIGLAWLAAAALASVEVNSASQAELEAVQGIGVAMSTVIIAERRRRTFDDWADFAARVPGVGGRNAARLSSSGLVVNGAALARPRPAAAPPK